MAKAMPLLLRIILKINCRFMGRFYISLVGRGLWHRLHIYPLPAWFRCHTCKQLKKPCSHMLWIHRPAALIVLALFTSALLFWPVTCWGQVCTTRPPERRRVIVFIVLGFFFLKKLLWLCFWKTYVVAGQRTSIKTKDPPINTDFEVHWSR